MLVSHLSRPALGVGFFASLAAASHFEVTVGKDSKLEFNPATIDAQVGDTVTYKFFSKNHAVAQSTFADPCHLQENGIFSGFTPNDSPDTAAATDFTITINDTKPLWFYCPQTNGNHCQSGMVHAINAPATGNTFDAYKTKAQTAATPSTPSADVLPVGGLRKTHVNVGVGTDLMFDPSNIVEPVGTVIEFNYNPKNHSIVQSSFDQPCAPIARGGFAAPFVPLEKSSGVTFEVTVTNEDPVWFYCAQTTKSHCQSGMVGALNAATEGDKTFDAFKALAAKAPPSTTVQDTPLVGALKINGTFIDNVGSSVLDVTTLDPSLGSDTPAPGMSYPPYIGGMAGGNQPANYGWGDSISDEAVFVFQSLQYIDNFLVVLLLDGYNSLVQGDWTNVYPRSIQNSLGSLAAQSLIHRRSYTDTLQHFSKDVISICDYKLDSETDSVDDWLATVLMGLHLSMGTTLDAITRLAESDSWTIPILATAFGTQTRMAALVNLMQNRIVAAAPREVLLPLELSTSYIASHFATPGTCEPPAAAGAKSATTFPALTVKSKVINVDTAKLTQITVDVPKESTGEHFIAWLGAWGGIQYTSVDAQDSTAGVPASLSGHVWAVLTSKADVSASELDGVTVAGPEMLWVSQQWSSSDE
ncbi:hypothetical protein GGR57DRAFT_99523 [Xylariaceae sp. FL1272]|nr:hypothetical protein GGR57DRAFT_99523 [Xylariaceae sp. FL1272]